MPNYIIWQWLLGSKLARPHTIRTGRFLKENGAVLAQYLRSLSSSLENLQINLVTEQEIRES
ncbi:hypothetical protein BDZ97DRAFT_1827433 [Flammula alnicola]|nr:hypothetical protein BDZ97DRAFT_1827433 [Flammula alnicola]